MRITGGIHRNRKLETPKGDKVRPTSDKVRQAVFNMLNARGVLHDAVVVDAFCGTGALGLEALSQGARFCTFFDRSKDSINLCKSNIQMMKEESRSAVIFQDATKLKNRDEKFEQADLVFLDPPYNQNLISPCIESLVKANWVLSSAVLVIECARDETVDSFLVEIVDEKNYGDTKILIAHLKN